MTNHLSGGEVLEGRVIVGLQLHDRLQTLGRQHWEAVLPEVSGGRKIVGIPDLAQKSISKKCYRRIGYRAECGKCHSQIFEIVQWQEGVFMDLRNVVLLHVPGQTIQDKSLHFFNISKIVGFLFFGSYNICRFWSPAKTFSDRAFILFLEWSQLKSTIWRLSKITINYSSKIEIRSNIDSLLISCQCWDWGECLQLKLSLARSLLSYSINNKLYMMNTNLSI